MLSLTTFAVLSALLLVARGSCECGFRDESGRVWMDAVIVPFDKVADLGSSPDLWMNDYLHPLAFGDKYYNITPANSYKEGQDLVMKVSALQPGATTIQSAQVSSRRRDYFYGTYRSLIKLPAQDQGSSCVGFFSYFNDTQEIDIEYIGIKPDMLYLSTKDTNRWSGGLNGISSYNDKYGNNLVDVYHDFRFDWLPNKVDFFVNNQPRWSSTSHVPSVPSRWMLMNWADGDKNWSGTPWSDSFARVRNVRAYFNSTHPYIIDGYARACAANAGAVCDVSAFPTTELYGYEANVIRKYVSTEIGGGGQGNGTTTTTSSSRHVVVSWAMLVISTLLFTI